MNEEQRVTSNEPADSGESTRATLGFNAYCVVAAFGAYFCMYAFRKPFSAGSYEDLTFLGMPYKSILILSQVAGYTLSKFVGIRFIASMKPAWRVPCILGFIAVAELALLLLAIVPHPYNFPCMFLNGLPLGMIWGFVFSFLEGRRFTEALAAGLSVSFVVSSGVVKGAGKLLIESFGVPEFWMPFCTGLLFTPPLLIFVWMLSKIPPPTARDEEQRSRRTPMSPEDRRRFLNVFGWGLAALIVFHMVLTAYRDFRDNFAVEILASATIEARVQAGESDQPQTLSEEERKQLGAMLTTSELPIGVCMVAVLGLLFVFHNHRLAITVTHALMLGGVLLSGVSTWMALQGQLTPFVWFILTGLGLYFAYVPFHSILFERMVAGSRLSGNAGYLIYIADATGYLASVLVLLYKDFASAEISYLGFFRQASFWMAVAGSALVVASLWRLRVSLGQFEGSATSRPATT